MTEFEESLDSLLTSAKNADTAAREQLRELLKAILGESVESFEGNLGENVLNAFIREGFSQLLTGHASKGPTLLEEKRAGLRSLLRNVSPSLEQMDTTQIFAIFGELMKGRPVEDVLRRLWLRQKGHKKWSLEDHARAYSPNLEEPNA